MTFVRVYLVSDVEVSSAALEGFVPGFVAKYKRENKVIPWPNYRRELGTHTAIWQRSLGIPRELRARSNESAFGRNCNEY